MASCVEVMLAKCSVVRFVDPHYDPDKRRFNQPLIEFLKVISSRSSTMAMPNIEYHAGNKNRALATIQADLEKWVQPALSKDQEFTLVRWDQEELHNRYIITDLGAVEFGNGLDENINDPMDEDEVSIKGEASRLELLEDYSPSSKKFNWLGETLTVVGQ
jgi:arginyl-tRNA--protein-N-Asp/Glu arginylyltransferase